ncbi:hypothetical protein BDV23DRAFT_157775 [Aspergillus alliaceus]|uniref:Uncharacterized protein n=1 Tax=Petromyces alliaceus TaxID=209559 RepID=A0A5N7C507_PETAA|nr:hypothetical protein BDV23DRAFT_157775 [Aspergillus alliaceus]
MLLAFPFTFLFSFTPSRGSKLNAIIHPRLDRVTLRYGNNRSNLLPSALLPLFQAPHAIPIHPSRALHQLESSREGQKVNSSIVPGKDLMMMQKI